MTRSWWQRRRRGRPWALIVMSSLPIVALTGALLAREIDDPALGIETFVLGDFGGVTRATLETNALPYKVVATALLLREERVRATRLGRADLPDIYRQFGFVTPERIANWPASRPQPRFESPLGMVHGEVRGPTPLVRIDAVNLGCATCHAGPLYGADGRATASVWAGLPNASINLEAYSQAVFLALASAVRDQGAFRSRVAELFPGMGRAERFTLRFLLMPRVARRIAELREEGLGPAPFSNGGAGRTNGVAALKRMLGLPAAVMSGHADVGFTSIPDLASRGLRTSLLYDGLYAPLGAARHDVTTAAPAVTSSHLDSLSDIVAFFTVSTMGVTPNVGEDAIPAMRPVMQWLGRTYAPPPFPGAIDSVRMRDGAALYAARCARCHGTYGEGSPRPLTSFPNALIEQEAMGTDSARWSTIDGALLDRLARSAYGRHMRASRTGGYVAPILSGLWTTAPYLHNGSVPTLWHLLTPSERPTRFLVGGHALDYGLVGIAGVAWTDDTWRYPPGYVPWSIPELYDTRAAGLSNRGHERPSAGLSHAEKRALIEYLKTL